MSRSNMQRIRKEYCSDIPGESIECSHYKVRKVSYTLLYNSDIVKSTKWQEN